MLLVAASLSQLLRHLAAGLTLGSAAAENSYAAAAECQPGGWGIKVRTLWQRSCRARHKCCQVWHALHVQLLPFAHGPPPRP